MPVTSATRLEDLKAGKARDAFGSALGSVDDGGAARRRLALRSNRYLLMAAAALLLFALGLIGAALLG